MLKLKLQYLVTWCEELTRWKRPWCWERLKAGGEGDNRGWDGWMASPTQWIWIWASSRSWWWTGKPGVLQSMGLQSRTQLRNKNNNVHFDSIRNNSPFSHFETKYISSGNKKYTKVSITLWVYSSIFALPFGDKPYLSSHWKYQVCRLWQVTHWMNCSEIFGKR